MEYSGMRRMVAFAPNEEARLDGLRDIPDDATVFAVPPSLDKEYSPESRGELLNAIRAQNNPMKRAALEDAYRQNFGEPSGASEVTSAAPAFDLGSLYKAGGISQQARAATKSAVGFQYDLNALSKAGIGDVATAEKPAPSGFVGRLKDTGIDLAKGVVSTGESLVGLGSIATGGLVGKGMAAIGYDPKQTQEWLAGFQSDARQQEEQDIQAADGFWDTLTAIGVRPGALVGRIVQSIPGTVGAGAVGGAVARRIAATAAAEAKAAGMVGDLAAEHIAQRVAEQTGKILLAASGAEGAQSAGSIAEAGRQAGREWSQYAAPAVAGGIGTAAIGRASMALGNKLGIGDIEADIAMRGIGGGFGKSAMGMAKRVPVEAFKEGVLEEMPQSTQEKAFENIATGRPWDEHLGKAAAEGLIAGAGMGGGHALISGRRPDVPVGETFAGRPISGYTTEQLFSLTTSPAVSDAAKAKLEAELLRRESADTYQPSNVDIQFQPGTTGTPESSAAMAEQIAANNARRQEQIDTIGFEEQQAEQNRQRQAIIDATPETQRFIPANRLLPAPSGVDFISGAQGTGTPSQWQNAGLDQRATERQQTIASGILAHHSRPSPELLMRLMRVDQGMATMLFNHWKANGLQNQGQEAAQEVSSKFDPQGLQPGTPEYAAAFDSWAAGQQESKRRASLEQRRVEGQAAVDKKNGWRKRLVSWFETAKDGDTITTDIEGEEYLVVEKTIKRNGKEIVSKRLVLVGNDVSNDQTIIEYRDGKAYTGPNTSQGIDESAGWAQLPETDIDSRAASLGKLLEEGIAKVGAGGTALDAAAHQAATSPLNDLPHPTDAQKEAGNYTKGHLKLHGLDIAIENPAGSERSGTDTSGKKWSVTMKHHYGYLKGTVGKDKDHVDVFLTKQAEQATSAWVVDQIDPKTGKLDEHKVVIGPATEAEARQAYLDNYDKGWNGLGAITEMPMAVFKAWAMNGKRKTAPVGDLTQGQYDAAKARGDHAEERRLAHLINQAKQQQKQPTKQTDTTTTATNPYGKVGVAPGAAHQVSLKDNGDGTATVMRGEEPFYDFENGDPVTVPTGATAGQIRQAVTDAGALSTRDKWFGVAKSGTKPAEAGTEPTKSEKQLATHADYTAPKSVEEARLRWKNFKGPEPERGQGHIALMDAVRKALDTKLFYNRDVENFVAKELGVTAEQRKAGTSEDPNATGPMDRVDGGAFGYDVYLAREVVESEKAKQAEIAAGERLKLIVGMNVGQVKLNDGKMAAAATVESLTPTGVVLTAKRGPQNIRITTGYVGLEIMAQRAGNEFFKKRATADSSNAKPVAAIAGKPVADMPVEQLQKIASGESKTFGKAAADAGLPVATNPRANVVIRDVRDRDGNKLGDIIEPYDGTEEGARKAAKRATNSMWDDYQDASNIQSRIGATDEQGRPKWAISPNLAHISPVDTVEGRATFGDEEAIRKAYTDKYGKSPDEVLTDEEFHAANPQLKGGNAQSPVAIAGKPVAEFRHEGFRIYPISIKGEARWAVQSLDNAEKEQKGERQIGGDAIVDTSEQAKKQAEDQVTERAKKAERQREFAKQDAADEAKREANRGLSITQRRANAALDKPTNLPVNAGVGRGSRREAMESAVSQGRAIVAIDVRDTAAYKRDEDEQGRLHRSGYGAFFGNDSHPQKMRFNELTAKLKNRDNYQKKEYRLYNGRDTDGGFYEITKTEYDYAKSLMTDSSNAKPVAAIAGKPVADMPVEQLQKIASGESKTFGKTAVDKAAAELARRDEAGSPKESKEPWQYGELEYGDKYIDEVVLPDLRKQLANAHGGKFQEYPSKAAAVRGLKERIDTLENHRDAKARKYYASLDDHYAAVRRALADGKEVPEKAYESYDDLKADVSAGRIKGDGQEVARVEQPQHIEAGQAEPATAPVIAASIKESAKNTPMNIEQAREWLLKQIDAAMIDAKSAKEEDVWDRAEGKVDLKGRMDVKETIGYKVFDVPGDGKFRVLNLKESLQKFKKQVAASPGFKKNATRPMSLASGNGGKTSVRDLLDDGEYVLAADYGHLTGKPLLFGAVRKGEAHPIAYTDAEPVDIKGIEAQVGREWNVTGKSFSWRVIETTTGASVSSESTKEKAISKALAHVDEHGTDKLIAQIKETPKVSQAELERQFTDWGSEEEARAQKQRDALERADTEDRAMWNSIWPLEDGEKRSPNPWNDIDHLQVAVLAKDAAKAGKGDEFVSLIERRRGGTNNVLALAARKALAEGSKPGKQSGDVDYKGFERTPTGNGNFTLKDGNLLVKVEAMGGGKFQASHGSAKSSPHINSEQGAVDWAANLRDASKKITAYPFYSNNKLFNAEGTAELPKDWTGVARSDSGKRFFYLGQENGERSFNPLKAESYEDALKEADGLKNDKPVVPGGYREVARGYFGGTIEKPIYAPFAEGERVRFIGGHAGNIQSFIGGPVTTGAIIKYDNGLTGRAEWRDVEAVKKPSAEQEPKNFKSIDTLNAANNPLGEDDWIRFADGSEWQVKGRMNGWALVQGKTEHPTVKNIMGQVPLIRAVIEANDAAQTTTGADDTTLTVKYGGSDLDIDLGKPAYQATMDDVEAAVRARGYSADANPRTKYDPMQMWRNAHATAVSVAAKDGKSIPARVLYDYRGLIRDDLNDEQADLAADKMVEVFRDTKDYEKAVQAYRDFGRSSEAAKERKVGAGDTAPAASIAGKPVSEMSDGMLNQIAKSSQPAAEKAKAEVAKRKKSKADPLADVREFYTPGNIIHVDYWNQYDKVLEFKEGDLPGQWNVKVIQVVKNADGQWVPKDERTEPARWHATMPGKDKVVDRVGGQEVGAGETATAGNTEDSGAELTYNKRNRLNRGLQWKDIENKDAALRVTETIKAKVYPKPDYQAMIDGGMQPIVAHIVKQAYDSIATKPQTGVAPTDANLRTYIDGVNRYMAGVMSWADNDAQTKAWLLKIGRRASSLLGAVRGEATPASAIAGETEKGLLETVYPNGWKESRQELTIIGGNSALRALQPSTDEATKALKDIEKGWPGKQEAWQKQGYQIFSGAAVSADTYEANFKDREPYVNAFIRIADKTRAREIEWKQFDGATSKDDPRVQEYIAGRLSEVAGKQLLINKRNSLIGIFDSVEQAKDKARELTKREGKESKVSDKGISVEYAGRTGPARRMEGEDISSDKLRETFGFKGVNFGNWMKGDSNTKERQLHLNHAYDAFLDLAEILNVPPKAMSLNGMLGLAIGAQGTGQYAAHFVPGVNEINLTRTSGAGSLAHEWGHAVDHYFARLGGLEREAEPFLTEHASLGPMMTRMEMVDGKMRPVERKRFAEPLRPEILDKFKAIVTAMNKRNMTPEEIKAQQTSALSVSKSAVDRWLKAIRKDFEGALKEQGELAPSLMEKFDAMAERIRNQDLGDGKIAVSSSTYLSPVVAEMRDAYKRWTGRTYSIDQIKGLQSNIDSVTYRLAAKDESADHVPQTTSTQYSRNAASLDSGKGGKRYWSTDLEKFARAFDAFVSDELDAKAAKNSYLSHTERSGETVPEGEERKAINTAFRDLVAEIKTKETDTGVAMFNAKSGSRGNPLDTAALEATIARVIAGSPSYFSRDTVVSAPLFADLPAAILAKAKKEGYDANGRKPNGEKLTGATYDGKVYLVQENISSELEAEETLLHERIHQIVHGNAKDPDGIALRQSLGRLYLRLGAKSGIEHMAKEAGIDITGPLAAFPNVAAANRTAFLAEEFLAHAEGQRAYEKLPAKIKRAIREFYGEFRDWLRGSRFVRIAEALGARLGDFTQADLAWTLKGIRQQEAGTGSKAIRFMTAYHGTPHESRAAPTNPQGPIWSGPESSRADDLIYTMQDKNVDLKRVQQGITKALGDIRDDVDAYLQEELFHGRAAKATEEFLERELQPFVGEMKQRGIDMDTLETFLWARHAKERNAQIAKINPDMPDGGSGLTDKQAADILAGKDVTTGGQTVKGVPQAKLRSLNDLAAKVDRMVAGNRILTETYELETPDTVAAWKGAYQHYVPLHREDADTPWAGNGTGQGYSVKGSSTKRATGSFRPVENILANLVLQRTRTITRGEKNRVAQALYGLAKESPNEGFWDTDNAPTIRTVENKAIYHVMDGKTEVANFTRMADAEKKARENPAWFMYQDWGDRVVEKIDPAFRSKPNVVWARFGGEDRFVIFNERDERAMRLAGSLKNLDADDISHLLGEVSRWTRYFASINTQYNPVFGVINLIRDAGTGLLNLKSTPLEGKQKEMLGNVWQALPAIYKAVRIDRQGGTPTGAWADLWEDFQEAGGKTGYRDMFKNSHEQHEALQMALDPTWWQGKWWGKALTVGGVLSVPEQLLADKIGKPVFEWLSDYNTAMENGIRLSAYKLALDEGMTKQRAASLAKNLTVNFNKKGQVARQAGALYAFFNASVQGTARMAETLHHGAKPGELLGSAGKQIVYGGMLLGAMQAMLLMMAGFDDDEPPEFVRDRNIIIPASGGKYLTVPLPLGFHVLPAIGRIGTEFVLGGFKKPGKHVAHVFDVLADSFNPIGNAGLSMQTLAPTVLDPAAALAENKDWTGKPIFRENMSGIDQKPGHARTKDTATGLSKGLAYLINAASGGTEFKPGMLSPTPDQIDYLIGQITGGVGRETSKAFQTGSAAITGEELPTYKIPLVGRFYGDTKGQAAVSGKFYENLKEMNEHQAEFMGLSKSNRSKEAQEYAKENPEAMLFREGDRLQRYISKLRDQKQTMLAKGEPREKIKAVDDQITKTMQGFNQRVDLKKNPQRGMSRAEAN